MALAAQQAQLVKAVKQLAATGSSQKRRRRRLDILGPSDEQRAGSLPGQEQHSDDGERTGGSDDEAHSFSGGSSSPSNDGAAAGGGYEISTLSELAAQPLTLADRVDSAIGCGDLGEAAAVLCEAEAAVQAGGVHIPALTHLRAYVHRAQVGPTGKPGTPAPLPSI